MNIREKIKGSRGITLIALVITIIVLLILAGVSISMVFTSDGLFKKASGSAENYNEAKAREALETVLMGQATSEKYSNPKYTQDEFLDTIILGEIPDAKIKEDNIIIVEGYAFEIDRSVPKIVTNLGKAKNLVSPTISTSVSISQDKKKATITVTAKEATNGIRKIEIVEEGTVIQSEDCNNTKEEITKIFTISRNGRYIIKVKAGLTESKVENITDLISNIQYTPNGNETWQKGYEVKVAVIENANNINNIKYQWTDNTAEPGVGTFIKTVENGTVTENTLTGKYYLWTLIENNEGNTRIDRSEEFWFDNTTPTADLSTEWLEEEQNRLKISVNNITDEQSGINANLIKLYVTPQDGKKEEKNINIENGIGYITVDGLNMESITEVALSISDNAGNILEKKKSAGIQYLIKDGQYYFLGSGTSGKYNACCAYIDNGEYYIAAVGDKGYSACAYSRFNYLGGDSKVEFNIVRQRVTSDKPYRSAAFFLVDWEPSGQYQPSGTNLGKPYSGKKIADEDQAGNAVGPHSFNYTGQEGIHYFGLVNGWSESTEVAWRGYWLDWVRIVY